MKYHPLSNKLICKVSEQKEKIVGGIIKPFAKDDLLSGVVVAVGRGVPIVTDEGQWSIVPLECEIGDTIQFPQGVGIEIVLDDEKFLLLVEDMVMIRNK